MQLVIASPGGEVMKKLDKIKFIEKLGQDCVHLTVGEAVGACRFMLHTCKSKSTGESDTWSNNV